MTTASLPNLTSLLVLVEFPRHCEKCGEEQTFRAGWEGPTGLWGYCMGCGDERVAPFTRTVGEVA